MPARITKFFHSRYAMFLAAVLMTLALWATWASGHMAAITGNRGIALPPAGSWLAGPTDLWAAIASAFAVMGLLVYINRRFNLLRNLSTLFVVLFAAMTAATPDLGAQFGTGQLLAMVMGVCVVLMFGSYARPMRRREVFLVFLLLSAGTATQYAFAVYIPVMAVCCMQMRLGSLRTAVAALLGLVTPWWLLLGLGIVEPTELQLPRPANIFATINLEEGVQLGTTVLFTACLFIVAVALNFFRTMAYNARARSYNGTVLLMGFVTIVAMTVDYNNVASYVPVLNICASLQAAQFFVLHRTDRSWIAILCILLAYAGFYIWNSVI